ncbi:MAG TPA: SBBP repeat-containing protein, partial [Thermodesulfobacteriota bacterium]|nr:SBBP repeat-containing protein [Thermodesulfobacteriota bacterium]
FSWAREMNPGSEDVFQSMEKLRLPFIANTGQVDGGVTFYARTFGGAVFLTKGGEIVYSLPEIKKKGQGSRGIVLREELVGATIHDIRGEGVSPTKVSYFTGQDRSKWVSGIPTYSSVSLGEVYNGIELKLKAYGNNVEKLFFVQPGSGPVSITVRLSGAGSIKVNEAGELEAATELGVVRFTRPVAYQEIDGRRIEITVAYNIQPSAFSYQRSALSNPNSAFRIPHSAFVYGFTVGAYDRSQTLVIDPLLASTYLGGGGSDSASSLAIDSSGNIYVAGVTNSENFPTTVGAYDTTYNASDVFISKLSADLSTLLASTYLGAGASDSASSITIDPSGNVYVTGYTYSSNFPTTPGAYDQKFNSSDYADIFISKLSPDLTTLLASTFLGGGENDSATALMTDASGNVYVTGWTFSDNFPTTTGAFDQKYNSTHRRDAFISKLSADLSTLLISTFLGGGGGEWVSSLTMDRTGNIYVTGWTASDNFPVTTGAYDQKFNSSGYTDAFVTKLSADLSALLASTYLGGGGGEWTTSIAIDRTGDVYVTGGTGSDNFPVTMDAYDEKFNSSEFIDAFVTKLSSDLSTLLASTYLGGENNESASSIAVDATGNIYVAGWTISDNFPTTIGAYDVIFNSSGYSDAFISKLNADLTSLLASTYLGGGGGERVAAMTIDTAGNVYVTGWTGSDNFPTTDSAYSRILRGDIDAFISRLDGNLSADLSLGSQN